MLKLILDSIRRSWFVCCLFLITFLITNWSYRYKEVGTSGVKHSASTFFVPAAGSGSVANLKPSKCIAGAPLSYRIVLEYPNRPPLITFSWLALATNILIWSTVLAAALVYEAWTRLPRKEHREKSKRKIGFFLSDTLLLTSLIACVFGYFQIVQYRATADKRLMEELNSQGRVGVRKAFVPSFLADYVPQVCIEPLLRISGVDARDIDNDLLVRILRQPHLADLQLGGKKFDAKLLRNLPEFSSLSTLLISSTTIDADGWQQLAKLNSLETLILNRLTSPDVLPPALLGNLGRLRTLDVRDAPLNLSEIVSLPIASELVALGANFHDENLPTTIENLESLEFLCLGSVLAAADKQALSLSIKNMPQLREIQLDAFQLVDLDVSNAPELQLVTRAAQNMVNRVRHDDYISTFPNVRHAKISGATKLVDFAVDGRYFESFECEDNPQLSFGVNLTNSYDEAVELTLPIEVRQRWVSMLPNAGDLHGIDYSFLPLGDLDLTPINEMAWLESVDLGDSGVSDQQLLQLKDLPALKTFLVKNSYVSPQTIAHIARLAPSLTKIAVNLQYSGGVDISDHANLTSIFEHGEDYLTGLSFARLVNIPELTEFLDLNSYAEPIEIRGTPRVAGLSFNGPLSKSAILGDFLELQYFAAGGPNVDDAIFDKIYASKESLQKLTLAFSDVSPDRLKRLSEFPKLFCLNLTGTKLTDEVVDAWDLENWPNLTVLRLDETGITAACVERLMSLPKLRSLTLNGNELQGLTAEAISANKNMVRLGIGGLDIKESQAAALQQLENLKALDLSASTIRGAAAERLASSLPDTLACIILTSAQIDSSCLMALYNRQPQILLELTNADSELRVLDHIVNTRNWEYLNVEKPYRQGYHAFTRATIVDHTYWIPELEGYSRGEINPYACDISNPLIAQEQSERRAYNNVTFQTYPSELIFEADDTYQPRMGVSGAQNPWSVPFFEQIGRGVGEFYQWYFARGM